MPTFKEPIKVICIDSGYSKKLIKGGIYIANAIRTSQFKRFVYLNDMGNYSINIFRLLDGYTLDTLPDFVIENNKKIINLETTNYTGQIVKCRYSSGSYKEDEYYYVEKQERYEKTSPYNRSTSCHTSYRYKFKIRGFRNRVNADYKFYEIPLIEQRSIKLKTLRGDKIKTAEQTRKFLLYSKKERLSILFQILAKTLIDINKIEINPNDKLDIVKLMIVRGKNYAVLEEDIIPFLKGKINTLIKPLLK